MSYNIDDYVETWMNDGYTKKEIYEIVDRVFELAGEKDGANKRIR
jgi:hypothetical protein